jgi:DeoR family transcriptional regulator, aga operon transcriptional repressor
MGLTGGNTTSEVARLLVDRTDLTVVTNALNIAAEIALRPRLRLVVTGGLTTHDPVEAKTNVVLVSRASRTIVVADGSKVGHDLLARIVEVQDVEELITDDSADESAVEALRRTGLKVTLT